MKELKINEELKSVIPPLSDDEYNGLEQSLLKDGCRDPLIVWGDTIVDGHNRYELCNKHGIYFQTSQKQFDSVDQAKIWMIDNQKGRRNLTDGWKFELAQTRKELLREKGEEKYKSTVGRPTKEKSLSKVDNDYKEDKHDTRKELAKELGWSTGKTAMADKVWSEAEPEVKEKVKKGEATINEAYNKIKQREKKKKIEAENTQRESQEAEENQAIIYNEDATSFLSRFEEKSVDLLLTDPPYSTDVENINEFIESWIYEALSKVKDTGRAFICSGAYPIEMYAYLHYLQNTDFIIDCPLIWTYRNTLGQTPNMKYNLNYQLIFHAYKETSRKLNNSITNEMFSVQDINAPDGRHGDRYFKWQKPSELSKRLIFHTTEREHTIIDPFAGSGTFVLDAAKYGRKGFGSERDSETCNIAKQRGCKVL